MTLLEKIFTREYEIVSQEELEEIEQDSEVACLYDNGASGRYVGYKWFTVIHVDGVSKDIYCKFN